ncbi:MAG: hypothetical protein VR77_07175 [Flavobacteriales bacterium BRH_c54]|nr:MAG: hypothetical protein VR77_07175 [Flavobacteriales bacterium BRH_c54]
MKKLLVILFFISFLTVDVFADSKHQIDSILTRVSDYTESVLDLRLISDKELLDHLKTPINDLARCKIYNALCWQKFNSDPPKAMEYAQLQQPLAEKSGNQDAIITSYDNMAFLYHGFNDNEKAIMYMLRALKIKEAINDNLGVSTSLSGLAGIYYDMNNLKLALNYYKQSLEIENKVANQTVEKIRRKAALIGNIGLCYVGTGEIDRGLETYLIVVKLYTENNLEKEASTTYSNIGALYLEHKKNYNQALHYFKLAAKFLNENEDVGLLSSIHRSLAEVYYQKNDYVKALYHGKKGIEYANMSNDRKTILEANKKLSRIYYNMGKYELAHQHFQIAFDLKDSIFNETSSQQIAEMQTKYNVEKKETENELLKTQNQLGKVELERKSTQQFYLIISLILAGIIGVYIMYSLAQKKKINKILNQKNEQISTKNKIIEEKNKDITDSLNYAKRIQTAILPEENLLLKYFDSFVYYLPKDIVSGDFFWIKEAGNKFYFSVVDCTGHGVPGAFMSIIGFNSLNRIVEDLQLSETGSILDKLNELVIHSIRKQDKDGSSVRDGMDLSFCCIDLESKMLQFSGANNPLYVLRTVSDDNNNLSISMTENGYNLLEIKADKMAIGGAENSKKYQTHQVQLKQGDTIYLFSDGYADQFGGPKGKKFMYRRFKELILAIQEHPMSKQKEIFDTTMLNWKGDIDQIDDICVLGVKI